jgi:hypothetical protein
MHRRFPATKEDTDVAERMITKGPLVVPDADSVVGHIKEKDINDLVKRDKKTILALSVIDQWINWQTKTLIDQDATIRKLDAKLAQMETRLERAEDQQKEEGWNWGIVKWSTATIIAAILVSILRWAFSKL